MVKNWAKEYLGWRKLTSLNLVIMQQAFNELTSDNMRIGELMGLQWSDIDFNKKVMRVRRSLCYFSREGKYVFE